ncbi:ankyrin repeat domain-containing protein [Wolbachia endosymbiont of Psylliodes chrysocephala]|uniref:ankyrin repeat domain-containing protein n=1 Tax=Wolbachia endosymbiont of Psylliodes chrysocephala TaxID=2883236 RepID=UPI00209EF911|nr:ankyrin repeat domain-containing protein [Wolbachia endosymbiont of Psylliodes chrysocephala]
MHYAASYGHKKMVDTLLKAEGININAVYKPYLWTPLHLAAKNGHIDIVRALVEKGIDLLLKDQNGKTPRDLAKNDDMKELLKEAEETQLRQLAIKRATKNGIIAGCLTALLGTAVAVALFATGTVAVELISIVIAVAAIAAAALAVGGVTYMVLKPSTEMDEVEEEQGITGDERKV